MSEVLTRKKMKDMEVTGQRWLKIKELGDLIQGMDLGQKLRDIEKALKEQEKIIKDKEKIIKDQNKLLGTHSKIIIKQVRKMEKFD